MKVEAFELPWTTMDNEDDSPSTPGKVRLQKYLSECGVASRRRSEALIARGRVQVNGVFVTELGTKITPGIDQVRVKGKLISPEERGILIFHKPESVMTTMDDPEGRPTVADYVSKRYSSYYPVGRLDWDSSGLVIMTNDGELAQRLLHPKYQVERTYDLLVHGSVPYEIESKFERGINLEDGVVRGTAKVLDQKGMTDAPSTWLRVTIKVGRNRVLRRTFDKLGFPVIRLIRIKHGPFRLGSVKSGEIKKLTEKEYQDIRSRVMHETS